jgi:hypothetical protein
VERQRDRLGGGVRARARQHAHPAARRGHHHLDHTPVLGVRERGGLARGAAGHEAIDARGHLLFDQVVQRALVQGSVTEGSHQRGMDAFEHG